MVSHLLQPRTFETTLGPDANTKRTRVLLIEDNPTDALLVCTALTDLRDRELYGPTFDIQSVDRLSTAIASLANDAFDVILLDLSLPDSLSSEYTLSHIQKYAPNIPIIVLTGWGDESFGLKMVRAGAQDYLVKSKLERYILVKAIRYAIERQRSEQALRKSEEEFRSIVETTTEWIWSVDLRGNVMYSNPTVESILGYKPEELLDTPTFELIHPEDRHRHKVQMADAAASRSGWSRLKLRWEHKNGTYRWLESNSTAMFSNNATLIGFRGSDRDVTDRELAKLAQTDLQLKLVAVQEEEKHRIARELHDQMGQSIAALILGLKSLRDSEWQNERACLQFQQLHNIANDLAKEVHSLALDLRPTALDDLGLEVALSTYLEGWSRRWQIAVDFHSHGLSDRRLPAHLETTIYRIAQEALTNIIRHARAQTVSLLLESTDNRVVAIIEDDGCGFDVDLVMSSPLREKRLGLLGMEERVALVGGRLTIESTQGTGTSIYVRIPITFQSNGELAKWTN